MKQKRRKVGKHRKVSGHIKDEKEKDFHERYNKRRRRYAAIVCRIYPDPVSKQEM